MWRMIHHEQQSSDTLIDEPTLLILWCIFFFKLDPARYNKRCAVWMSMLYMLEFAVIMWYSLSVILSWMGIQCQQEIWNDEIKAFLHISYQLFMVLSNICTENGLSFIKDYFINSAKEITEYYSDLDSCSQHLQSSQQYWAVD